MVKAESVTFDFDCLKKRVLQKYTQFMKKKCYLAVRYGCQLRDKF